MAVVGLLAVLLGLWWINHALGLEDDLWSPPGPLGILRSIWLPMLFILASILFLLGRQLWGLLGPDPEPLSFPDIDRAWDEAIAAIEQAGIDLSEYPVFLLLGRPELAEPTIFGGGRPMRVRQAPRRPDAPLRAYADDEAIYITLPGASLLTRWSNILASRHPVTTQRTTEVSSAQGPTSFTSSTPENDDDSSEFSDDDLPQLGPVSDDAETQASLSTSIPGQITPGPEVLGNLESEPINYSSESSEYHSILLGDSERFSNTEAFRSGDAFSSSDESEGEAPNRETLLGDSDEVELYLARLRYSARLIGRSRLPYCPVNGVAFLLPLAATDTNSDAKETATLCRLELKAIQESLRLDFPILAVMCDLELLPGGRYMIERVPDAIRDRALGRSFPLVPDLDENEYLNMLERGVEWISSVLFPTIVYNLFADKVPDKLHDVGSGRRRESVNAQLFQLLIDLRRRQRRLTRLLTMGIAAATHRPPMLSGLYLAGTGFDPDREQAFVPGLFRLLIENQNFVSWEPEVLSEEANYQRWTAIGYLTLIVFITITLLLIIPLVFF